MSGFLQTIGIECALSAYSMPSTGILLKGPLLYSGYMALPSQQVGLKEMKWYLGNWKYEENTLVVAMAELTL